MISSAQNVLRVAAITPGRDVPSARFRVRQLVPALAREGVAVDELVPAVSAYPPAERWMRPFWGAAALAVRAPIVAATRGYALTLLQRELISTLVTLEPLTRAPRVLDVDDAIFLGRGERAARRLAELADSVVCGNAYLAEWFGRHTKRVSVIPTAVDTRRYVPPVKGRDPDAPVVVGWMGTSSNLHELVRIEDAIAGAMKARSALRLLVVCDREPELPSLPRERVEYRVWSAEGELGALHDMSIGIMPLEDSPWARGKCSLKMLLYLAAGLPVVASPVGTNAEIFARGPVGIAGTSEQAWTDALVTLGTNAELRATFGTVGRGIVERDFSVDVVAPLFAAHLRAVAGIR